MRRVAAIALLLVLPALAVTAHPHMWIDGTVGLIIDGSDVTGLEVEWLFDEFNSADMIFTFDTNLDGSLSQGEIDRIEASAFDHLMAADYFALMFQGITRVEVGKATDFSAGIRDGRIMYSFTLPFEMSLGDAHDLTIALFDPSYWIDFITEPSEGSYLAGIRFAGFQAETLHLQTQGWGVVSVPAVRLNVQ